MMCTATSAPGEVASFAAFFDDGELLVVPISAAQLPVRLKAYPWQKRSNTLWLEFLEEMDPLSTDRRDLVLVVHFIISEANCPTAVGERSRICAMRCITQSDKSCQIVPRTLRAQAWKYMMKFAPKRGTIKTLNT